MNFERYKRTKPPSRWEDSSYLRISKSGYIYISKRVSETLKSKSLALFCDRETMMILIREAEDSDDNSFIFQKIKGTGAGRCSAKGFHSYFGIKKQQNVLLEYSNEHHGWIGKAEELKV